MLAHTPPSPALLLSTPSRRLTLLSWLRLLRLLATELPALLAGGLLLIGLSLTGLPLLPRLTALLSGLAASSSSRSRVAALLAELLLATASGRLLSGPALLPTLLWVLASLRALYSLLSLPTVPGLRRLLAAELATPLPRLSLLAR